MRAEKSTRFLSSDSLEEFGKRQVEPARDPFEQVYAWVALAGFDFAEVGAFDVDHVGERDLRQSLLLSQKTYPCADSFSRGFSHGGMVSLAIRVTVFDRIQLQLTLGNEHVCRLRGGASDCIA